jgi:hypothetical protein
MPPGDALRPTIARCTGASHDPPDESRRLCRARPHRTRRQAHPRALPGEEVLMCADNMSTGCVGAESANSRIGDTVALLGQGPIGLCATAGARLRGTSTLIAIDGTDHRLDRVRRLSHHKINAALCPLGKQRMPRLMHGRAARRLDLKPLVPIGCPLGAHDIHIRPPCATLPGGCAAGRVRCRKGALPEGCAAGHQGGESLSKGCTAAVLCTRRSHPITPGYSRAPARSSRQPG